MRSIPFKALLALVILPPILYVGAIQGLEDYLAHYYRREILNRIPGDTQALLAGRTQLVHQIEATIDDLFAASDLLHRGVVLSVAIRTGSGRRLYPPVYDEGLSPESAIDPMRTASENFVLLNEGLDVTLSVSIADNTTVSNSVLAFAILVALTGLVILYRRGDRILEQEAKAIQAHENEQKRALAHLEVQKESLTVQVTAIEAELAAAHERAARNEADLFDEVESLENKLHNTLKQQAQQQDRIQELENHLNRLSRERQALAAQQNKAAEGLRKRLETLYKQASFTDRAVNGLAALSDALQIKAEEIIHQLNAHTDEVAVKRKLFRGKGKETVFEIVFARKGRLYFRRTPDRRVEILVVGTKNTQSKDLIYLDRIL